MKKSIIKLMAVVLCAVILCSTAAASYQSGVQTGDLIRISEGFVTAEGVYIPPGFYSRELLLAMGVDISEIDGSGEQDDPSQTDPTEPVDPEVPIDDPSIPVDPEPSEEPDEPQPSENPDEPDPAEDPDEPEPSDDPSDGDTDPQVNPELSKRIVRIGLRYGSSAMDGANLGNTIGSGFRFGYYNSDNEFVPVGYTSKTTISVVKTENVYYGTYDGYATYYDHLTGANVGVGCYHLQLYGSYASFEEASAVAAQYTEGFVAYISGTYYVRLGNYLNREDAVAAQNDYAAAEISTELKGTSSYALSVVVRGTNTILFQYDDNGSGTGLGVEPIPASEGQKCVSVFAGVDYYGGFRYERINGGDLTIVNMIAVDDYIKGVVCNEMSPSWPSEALKAQAVCARSYVLHNLNRHSKYHFDACQTVCCQSYGGLTNAAASTDAAVDSTMGIVARYNGSIANTVFYSSNGGASEASSTVWGGSQSRYPYLVGVVDPYESGLNINNEWSRSFTGDELKSYLRKMGYANCTTIVSVKISEYTATGNPAQITFTDSQGRSYQITAYAMNTYFPLRSWRYEFVSSAEELELTINGEEAVDTLAGLYAIDGDGNLVPVQDNAYIITDDGVISSNGSGVVTGDTFTIKGRGWGHNVGMSQYGAYAMAKLGYTYDQILEFYYTGITVG